VPVKVSIGVELLKWMAKVDLCIRDFDLAAPQAATCIQSVVPS